MPLRRPGPLQARRTYVPTPLFDAAADAFDALLMVDAVEAAMDLAADFSSASFDSSDTFGGGF